MRLRELPSDGHRRRAIALRVMRRFWQRHPGPWDSPTLRHCHPVVASMYLGAFPQFSRPPYDYAREASE